MKKLTPYIYMVVALLLTACAGEELPLASQDKGTLVLNVSTGLLPEATTRAVDAELTVDFYKADGSLFRHFEPGEAPDKLDLIAGETYTVRAYTNNQTSWQKGAGEACFYGQTTVSVGEDEIAYLNYRVPMTNYAVTFTLPEGFDRLFTAQTFTVKVGDRSVELHEAGQKAYFAVDETGFRYQLQATNTDGKTSRHSLIDYPEVEAGKCYNIKYIYGTEVNQGGIDIDITDNTEHEDVDIEL